MKPSRAAELLSRWAAGLPGCYTANRRHGGPQAAAAIECIAVCRLLQQLNASRNLNASRPVGCYSN